MAKISPLSVVPRRERKKIHGGRILPGCPGGASMRSGGRLSDLVKGVAEASECCKGARAKDVATLNLTVHHKFVVDLLHTSNNKLR